MNNLENEVEFNNGFVTALTLFYGHNDRSMRDVKMLDKTRDYRLDGAKDHLIDIEIPDSVSDSLRTKIQEFREQCFNTHHKHSLFVDAKIVDKLFEECQQLLQAIDEECFNLKVTVNYP